MFHNYEYFLAIVKYGGITKASEYLCISQPSLSNYLTSLEIRLKTKLFDRKNQPLTLTESGKSYLVAIEKYQDLIHDLMLDINNANMNLSLKIGIAYWRSSQILPTILKTFQQEIPKCLICVEERPGIELYEQVLQGKIDFCFLNIPDGFIIDKKLTFLVLEKETIELVYNQKNPLSSKKIHTKQSISNANVILLHDNQFLTIQIKEIFEQLHITPKTVFNTISLNTALNIVSEENYITFVPNSRFKGNSNASNIVYSGLKEPEFSFNFGILYAKKHQKELSVYLNLIKSLYI